MAADDRPLRPGGEVQSVEDLDVDPRGGRALSIAGIACIVLTVAFAQLAMLTGTLAMVFGTLGHVKRDPWGIRVAVVGGVVMVLALAFQALVLGSGGVAA